MSSSLINLAIGDLQTEFGRTRTMLERLPEDRFDWRPHEKSWTMLEISSHLANLPVWMLGTITEDGFDMATTFPPRPKLNSREEVLQTFNANCQAVLDALGAASDDDLQAPWALLMNGTELWSRPKLEVIREWGISHMIHHRGQLTIYYRLNGVSLPPLYGPTADEPMGG